MTSFTTYGRMSQDDIENYIHKLCKTNETGDAEFLFKHHFIDPKCENYPFVGICAMYGNLEMLRILRRYGAVMDTDDNEALRLASQNGHIDCARFLYGEGINIEEYRYSLAYDNLSKWFGSNVNL